MVWAAADWLWSQIREQGLAQLSQDPDSEYGSFEDRIRTDAVLIRELYPEAETAEERFLLLSVADFGKSILEEGRSGANEFVAWLASLDLGADDLQARFLAHAFEVGSLEWNAISFDSSRCQIGSSQIHAFAEWVVPRWNAGKRVVANLDPFAPDIPSGAVVVVAQALREGVSDVWASLRKAVPAAVWSGLRELHNPSYLSQILLTGPRVGEPGGVLRNLWQAVRAIGPERLGMLPDFWVVRERLRADPSWLTLFYQGAQTPSERFHVLQIAGFGASFSERHSWEFQPENAPERVHRWLGGLDVGDPALQAQLTAWALWFGNRPWSRQPLTSDYYTLTAQDVQEYATWVRLRRLEGRDLGEEVNPWMEPVMPSSVPLVDRALREERADIWAGVQSNLSATDTEVLVAAMYPNFTR